MNSRVERLSGYAILVVMAIGIVIPFLSIFMASMQPSGSAVTGLSWPDQLNVDNYREAWTVAGFGGLLRNSLMVGLGVVPVSLLIATLAGYALGTMNLPGGNALFLFFLAGLTIPVEVLVIPLYFDLQSVGLGDSLWGVILAEIALFMPFSVFWMRTHFLATPRELIDAARVDGASSTAILRQVLLPLARPSLMTLAVLVFMWSWNQFLLVLILIQDPNMRTAPAGLGFFVGQHATDIPVLSAGTVIVILPMLILYLAFQRSFISGLLQGAFKG